MNNDITKLTDAELESFGYKLHETKDQLIMQLEQANRNLLMIRVETQGRIAKKAKGKNSQKPKK